MGERGFNTVGEALSRAVQEKNGDLAEVVHHVNFLNRCVDDLFRRVDELQRQVWWLKFGSAVYFVGACATAIVWALI